MAEPTRRDQTDSGIPALNGEMDRAALCGRVNEPFLEGCLERLDGIGEGAGSRHWLTLARLTELTLWCAGGYADAGLFGETGDLLFNPRKKYLVRKRGQEFVELERHRPISAVAEEMGLAPAGAIETIKKEFRLVIEKKALMPELTARLEAHPTPSGTYLRSVESRLVRVSSTLCFHSTLTRPQGMDIAEYLNLLPEPRKRWVESQMCRFDLDLFQRYGKWLALGPGEFFPGPPPGAEDREGAKGAGRRESLSGSRAEGPPFAETDPSGRAPGFWVQTEGS